MMSNLTWFGWLYLVLVSIGVICNIATIGLPRKSRTQGDAIIYMIWTAFFIWGAFNVGFVRQ